MSGRKSFQSWKKSGIVELLTSRERHKSAPYLRLKNSKRTSKCKVFLYSTRKTQKLNRSGSLLGIFFFQKKPHNAEKTESGDPLVSPGTVCYAEKQEKPFWFSSLAQMVQFGTIKFCRTFKNYSQLRLIRIRIIRIFV